MNARERLITTAPPATRPLLARVLDRWTPIALFLVQGGVIFIVLRTGPAGIEGPGRYEPARLRVAEVQASRPRRAT